MSICLQTWPFSAACWRDWQLSIFSYFFNLIKIKHFWCCSCRKSMQRHPQSSNGTDGKWRSHNLHSDKSVKGCTLITVPRWNTAALPRPFQPSIRRQTGCGRWSAASAVSTGGRHRQRGRRRSDYVSEGQRMTWPELRGARQLAGAPTLIRKISNWGEVNGRTNPLAASLPPRRRVSHHSSSFCFLLFFHHLTRPRPSDCRSKSRSSTLASCLRKVFQSVRQCTGFRIPSASL